MATLYRTLVDSSF